MGGLASLPDCPDDQRLTTANIAGGEELFHAGAVVDIVCHNVGGPAKISGDCKLVTEIRQNAALDRAGKADCDEGKVRLDDELGAFDRLALFVNLAALHTHKTAVFADEFQRSHLELAL